MYIIIYILIAIHAKCIDINHDISNSKCDTSGVITVTEEHDTEGNYYKRIIREILDEKYSEHLLEKINTRNIIIVKKISDNTIGAMCENNILISMEHDNELKYIPDDKIKIEYTLHHEIMHAIHQNALFKIDRKLYAMNSIYIIHRRRMAAQQ